MAILVALLCATISGCAGLDLADELIYGPRSYTAGTLAGSPTPSPNCSDAKCKRLDALEAKGYEMARANKIKWVQFVDAFYSERAKLYPDSDDSRGASEIRAYQRALAEQMDNGKITESQWSYLIERKGSEVRTRNENLANSRDAAYNSRPRQRVCNTTNLGTRDFPNYQTTCN